MKNNIYIILIILFVFTVSTYGQIQGEAIDIGRRSSPFVYIDTQDTNDHYDYTGSTPNEVYYRFELDIPMDITISHCGSVLQATTVVLIGSNGYNIAESWDAVENSPCSNPYQAYIRVDQLPAGVYYVMSEGAEDNGYLTTRIEGIIPGEEIFQEGNTFEHPIDLGTLSSNFTWFDTRNTNEFTDEYQGRSTKDVFYKFRLSTRMNVKVSHAYYFSGISDTYVSVLNSFGVCIGQSDHVETVNGGSLLMKGLEAGTYYVVSEGYEQNGAIKTCIVGEVTSQPFVETGRNYISTLAPTVASSTSEGLNIYQSIQDTRYFDGLGRPVQHVQKNAGTISYREYDEFGRESKVWLPTGGNNFKPFTEIAKTSERPFSTSIYEKSALERITEQYGFGKEWWLEKKSTKTVYADQTYYGLPHFKSTDNKGEIAISLLQSSYENRIEASETMFIDEDGSAMYHYKDKSGQLLQTRQGENRTNYIYDRYGNLRVVLPPLASDGLSGNAWDESDPILQQYAYLYKYDDRNRCIAKKLPDADWILYVYDPADRLIFTQDGEQRLKGEWLFTIPDALNRVVLTGTCKGINGDLAITNDRMKNQVIQAAYRSDGALYGYHLTINSVTSTLDHVVIHTVNYYDNYHFVNYHGFPSYMYDPAKENQGYGTWYSSGSQSLLTGTMTATTDNNLGFLYTVLYYDYRGRQIQTQSSNHLGGKDTEYIGYTFRGQPSQRTLVHTAPGQANQIEYYGYNYDQAERLTYVTHGLNGESRYISTNYYDLLGRVVSEQLNDGYGNMNLSYNYDIRSRLLSSSCSQFTQQLSYTYSSNIQSMSWTQDGQTRSYAFRYDLLSRLTHADYSGIGNEEYSTSYNYDKHGNMVSLQRYGRTAAGTSASCFGLMDNLTMTYSGNQLVNVADDAPDVSLPQSNDFKKLSSAYPGYAYNKNGAMTKDLHKGISSISYNSLNLPLDLTIGGARNTYTYAADGRKLRVTHGSDVTDYVGNKIYENGSLKRILFDGGYIENDVYYFYLTDHLGNNRVVVKEDGEVIQRNDYYPFGMAFAEASDTDQNKQPYQYNCKELDRRNGLNLYDYSARYMEPALGRFTTMDPLAEADYSISPYIYCDNNPLKYIDIGGLTKYLAITMDKQVHYRGSNMARYDSSVDHHTLGNGIDGFVSILKDASASDPEGIGFISIWSHGIQGMIYEENNSKNNSIGIRDLGKLQSAVKNGEIIFAKNAIIYLGGCNAGTDTGSIGSLAQKLSDITGAIVVAADGSVAPKNESNGNMVYTTCYPRVNQFSKFFSGYSQLGIGPEADVLSLLDYAKKMTRPIPRLDMKPIAPKYSYSELKSWAYSMQLENPNIVITEE